MTSGLASAATTSPLDTGGRGTPEEHNTVLAQVQPATVNVVVAQEPVTVTNVAQRLSSLATVVATENVASSMVPTPNSSSPVNVPTEEEAAGAAVASTTTKNVVKTFNNGHSKPPLSYAGLITEAIEDDPMKKRTLCSIYDYISAKYPFYDRSDHGWQVDPSW